MGYLRHLWVLVTTLMIGLSACSGVLSESTATSALPAALVISMNKPGVVNADAIPVRRGPGVEFEQAATINHDYGITLVGQSADGKWYKVEIPGYVGDQSSLWIAVDFVNVSTATEMVTLTAVLSMPSPATAETITAETITAQVLIPSPIATSQPSTSSCRAPAGWVTYVIRPGDTLFRLATKTNTAVDQIVRANCLTSTQIVTGSRLYLPFVPPAATLISIQTTTPTNTPAVFPPLQTDTPLPVQTPTVTATGTPPSTSTPFLIDTPSFTPTAVLSPTSAISANSIRNFRVISDTARDLQFTVDYNYDGGDGEIIFGAGCLGNNAQWPCNVTSINPWELGGPGSGRLTINLGYYGFENITTDQVTVWISRRDGWGLVYEQTFDYIKSWIGNLPTPTMVR